MSDTAKQTITSSEEQQYLRRSLRRIIIGQEIGPRTPRWRAAWKRTLIGYVDRLDQLSAKSEKEDQGS
jgi:hypothetical protein